MVTPSNPFTVELLDTAMREIAQITGIPGSLFKLPDNRDRPASLTLGLPPLPPLPPPSFHVDQKELLQMRSPVELTLPAVRIIESLMMVEVVDDWSHVRSHSRARRRLRQGHRQNIRQRLVPRKDAITIDGGKTYVMHPALAKELRNVVARKGDALMMAALNKGAFDGR